MVIVNATTEDRVFYFIPSVVAWKAAEGEYVLSLSWLAWSLDFSFVKE